MGIRLPDNMVPRLSEDEIRCPSMIGNVDQRLMGRPDVAAQRLEAILTDKVLRFNPYTVSDEDLLACAGRGWWRPFPALTQMVIFHFLDIREVPTSARNKFEAIFYRVGDSPREYYIPLNHFTNTVSHHTCKQPHRSQLNGRNITPSTIPKMVNRTCFVSHAIVGHGTIGKLRLAYRMQQLKGPVSVQSNAIREQMICSKIAMLEEVLNYPQSPVYLGYKGPEFDHATLIQAAIATINSYPTAPLR